MPQNKTSCPYPACIGCTSGSCHQPCMLSLSHIRASLPLQVLTNHVGSPLSPDKPACVPSCSETAALSLQVVCVQDDSLGHINIEAAATFDKWRVLLMAGNINEAKQHDHHSMDIKHRVLGQNQPQVCLLSSNSCLIWETARGRP